MEEIINEMEEMKKIVFNMIKMAEGNEKQIDSLLELIFTIDAEIEKLKKN